MLSRRHEPNQPHFSERYLGLWQVRVLEPACRSQLQYCASSLKESGACTQDSLCQSLRFHTSQPLAFEPHSLHTLLTFWPPAPPERIVVISRSDSGTSTSFTLCPAGGKARSPSRSLLFHAVASIALRPANRQKRAPILVTLRGWQKRDICMFPLWRCVSSLAGIFWFLSFLCLPRMGMTSAAAKLVRRGTSRIAKVAFLA